MSNIIKRRHTNQYAQIHNNPLQNDLIDLRSIGLLSHLMSLPNDWVIYKTQLYKKFSRKNIDAAWKELVTKNYIIGFNCYIDGKRQSFYNVSDIPFVPEEYSKFIYETVFELKNSGLSIKSLSSIKDGNYDITDDLADVPKVHQSNIPENFTTVPKVQHSQYSTQSTYTKEVYTNKKLTNNDDEDIANISHLNNSYFVDSKKNKQLSKVTLSDDDILWITDKIRNIFKGKIQKRSFDSVLKKCINNYKRGKVPNYENYLITAIENKISELELRREREKALLDLNPKVKKKMVRKEIIPDWLREQKENEKEVEVEEKLQNKHKTDIETERKRLDEVLKKYRGENN
ncbi:TPA: hypothetical protein ACGXKN_005141 [Bacillus cereus]